MCDMSSDQLSSSSSSESGLLPNGEPRSDLSSHAEQKSVLKDVAYYIIVTEFCERLAFYGFAGSLVLFFQTKLHMDNATADIQYSLWSGACYLTPLLGGYIADTRLGRYQSILVFCCIYGIGLVMIVIGSVPGATSPAIVFPAIYIIALGTGGIKPNVSTLGADQFSSSPQDVKEKESFFNWFYWSINLGAGISYTFISYICQYGIPALGGLEWSFFVGYSIPCVAMALAVAIFVSGTSRYTLLPVAGKSVITSALGVVYEALWTNRQPTASGSSRLDHAKVKHGGSFTENEVEAVKLVADLVPFLFILIPFWGIYSQTNTGFQNQGCQMDLQLSADSRVPVSALNIFNTVAIILLVPLFDSYFYPMLKSRGYSVTMLRKMGLGFIFAGLAMVVAGLIEVYRRQNAPASGGWEDEAARDNISPCHAVEDYNPYEYQQWEAGQLSSDDEPQNCHQVQGCNDRSYDSSLAVYVLNLECIECDDIPQMSHLSVFWQIPQFFLIGVAEILSSITALEFFYSQAPSSMRSVSQALNLLTTALGSWLIIPLIYIVNSGGDEEGGWVAENIDDGHLEYYFFLLAALMFGCLAVFTHFASEYEYKSEEELQKYDETDRESRDESRSEETPSSTCEVLNAEGVEITTL